MHLKIILVPSTILLSLILAIGFIKPDVGVLQEKKMTLTTKLEQTKNMETLLENISSLRQSLDKEKTAEDFVMIYLPNRMDQERVVDMFNFLAAQAGVFISGMNFAVLPNQGVVGEDQSLLLGEPLVANGPVDASGIPTSDLSQQTMIERFSATITVTGKYESIKDFFSRVAHMNRFHTIQIFSLKSKGVESGDASQSDVEEELEGVFLADFNYFAVKKVGSALDVPLFSRAHFDISQLDTSLNWVKNNVSVLEAPSTGRPNPFQ